MNGDAEILLPDGSIDIKFTGGSHDFYVTGNATLNVPDFINQARIYILPGKTLTLNMGNYINDLEIYVANNATLNYNYDKLYYQNGGGKIFNRGTLNLGRDNFEINQNAIVYNEGTIIGKDITSKPGDGNPSFLYNYGEISISGKFQLNSCANFYNEGTFTAAGETELTQGNSKVWRINKGTYTTAAFTSAGWNGECYNFCRLSVTGDATIHNGVFHMMDNSYAECNRGLFNNIKFLMGNNSGFNVKNGTKWGRDGADFMSKYAIQGFEATDDNAKAFIRLAGNNSVPDHKGSAFHVKGANLTLAYQDMKFYSGLSNNPDQYSAFDGISYWSESTEASLQAAGSENSTWNTHNVKYIVTGADFAATGFTLKDGECSAKWNGDSANTEEENNNEEDNGEVDPNPIIEEGRIMCEDLGVIGDFDFNDVVFDAEIHQDGTTIITVLAAGGTLELTVAGEEVHALFGVELKDMVNTGIMTKAPVTFTAKEQYRHLIDIPIVVRKQDGQTITSYILTAIKGQAPQKICVPRTTLWPKEYKSIKLAYPEFVNWVEGEDAFNWNWTKTTNDLYIYKQ
jgi:hypothetical protein